MTNDPLLLKAIQLAKTNPIQPIGRNTISRFCAILSNGRQTFYGFNSYRSHPLQAKYAINSEAISIHAEIDACRKAINWNARQKGIRYGRKEACNLSDYTIAIARILRDDSPSIGCPCVGCMSALTDFGITDIRWTK